MSVARILEIAKRMEANYGIELVFNPGWDRLGNGMSPNYSGIVQHHMATAFSDRILPVLIKGRPDLSGPLTNFTTLSSGKLGIVAAFPANHAGASGGYNTAPLPVTRSFNSRVIGNEIAYPGSQPMTAEQYRTATILGKVAVDVCGYGDVNRIKAHAETSITGKWDPGYAPGKTINMNKFRDDAAAVRSGGSAIALEEDMSSVPVRFVQPESDGSSMNKGSAAFENFKGSALWSRAWVVFNSGWGDTTYKAWVSVPGKEDPVIDLLVKDGEPVTVSLPLGARGINIQSWGSKKGVVPSATAFGDLKG